MYMYILDFSRLQFRAVLLFLFLTFCVINVQTNESVKYSIPTEPTEEKPTLCRNHTTSCSHQIPMHGATQDSCSLVRYEPISEDCKSPNFKGTLDPDEVFGKVILSAYILFDNYPVTAFNVTFTDIKWSRARLRFYESGSEVPDLCREFQVMPEIPSNTSLFFDCLWKLNIESKAYHFQYIAHPRSDDRAVAHQFVFFVPSVLTLGATCVPNCIFRNDPVDIRKLQLFVSVEVSVLPVLRLHIQTAPEIYNITRYKIELVRTWVDYKWPVMTKEETVLPNQTHIYLVHNTDYRPGIYNFSVTPLHDSCKKGECAKSVAPGIPIVASTETPLLIVMVGTVILIPVLIAVYFMWRRTCVPRPTGNEPWQPPKVLLVYNPDYKSHVSDMIRFTEYLKKKCRVEPMFDLFCIPNSNSKDPPTVWYREAYESADFILIFAPPTGPESSEPHEWNPFLNLQIISLNQLRLFTARHNIIYSRLRRFLIGNTQIFAVKLPGCTWDKLYPEAEHFKRLTLPKDIDKLLDPTKWYREAFRQADFILVFASPPGPKSTEPHKCNPYLHLDKIALNQLRLMLAVPGPSCRVVSVLLPGCSWETLPHEATRLRQFTLPRDLDPLLVCLGAAPQCDGGEGLRDALANDIRPDTQPLPPQTEPILNVSRKCISIRNDDLRHQPSEISRMNLMGTHHKDPEPEVVQHIPRRDDTLLDIGDLNLSGGC